MKPITLALALGAFALPALGQVVINEVFPNPPGSGSAGDDRWEYIELYGVPGTKLDGYMLAPVYGGADEDADQLPGPLPTGWDVGDEYPEIDEAWSLDGLTIGSNGFLVLYNSNGGGSRPSFIPALLPAATNRATFLQCHIPSSDVAGRIKNDGSATFILIRRRPFHVYDTVQHKSLYDGSATYFAGSHYAWRKDVNPDVNFNSRLDFGVEAPAGTTLDAATILEPYQMVDDIAVSNAGGKEFVRSNQQRVSDTPGYNPDAMSRVQYYGTNPHRGWRVSGSGDLEYTTMADEEFIYGDVPSVTAGDPQQLWYDPTNCGGPTDRLGPKYNALGQLDVHGTYLMNDVNHLGFKLTPGTFNDVNSTSVGGSNITQFRFLRGDFNFDGKVDIEDLYLINQRLGASLDDTATLVNDNNTVDTADDTTYTGWKWQGRDFQALLAMMSMDAADGAGGVNAATVTAKDIAAEDFLVQTSWK